MQTSYKQSYSKRAGAIVFYDEQSVCRLSNASQSITGAEGLTQAMRTAKIDFRVVFDSDLVAKRLAGPDGFALIVARNGR